MTDTQREEDGEGRNGSFHGWLRRIRGWRFILVSMMWPYQQSLTILGSVALLVGAAVGSERLSVYRCSDGNGAVSLQDQPCPKGTDQSLRRLRRPIDPSPEVDRANVRATDTSPEPKPPIAESNNTPPPPLWTCVDFDGNERESVDGIGRGRYVPLWVVGRDPYAPRQLFGRVGGPLPQPSLRPATGPQTTVEQNPGSAPLVYVEEHCYRLSAEQTCLRYAAQRREIERAIFNRQSSERAVLEPQSTALRILLQEHCGH